MRVLEFSDSGKLVPIDQVHLDLSLPMNSEFLGDYLHEEFNFANCALECLEKIARSMIKRLTIKTVRSFDFGLSELSINHTVRIAHSLRFKLISAIASPSTTLCILVRSLDDQVTIGHANIPIIIHPYCRFAQGSG